ncbi:MAG: 2,3,4,5-tetrahydropyridine-2,6-dicarboxylate N-acetyltransferase, partial [Eubacterium sp.]
MTNEELKKQFDLNDPYQIAKYIKKVKKATPIKAFVRGYLRSEDLKGYEYYGDPSACIILGEAGHISELLDAKAGSITSCRIEGDRRNSAIPLMDLTVVDARIEPGAYIREGAHIGKNAIIMMGAVINIGASIGDGTMI